MDSNYSCHVTNISATCLPTDRTGKQIEFYVVCFPRREMNPEAHRLIQDLVYLGLVAILFVVVLAGFCAIKLADKISPPKPPKKEDLNGNRRNS
jgi:thiosulfate reductase cytochrome b subunit